MTSLPCTTLQSARDYATFKAKRTRVTWYINRLASSGVMRYEASTRPNYNTTFGGGLVETITPPQCKPDHTFTICVNPVRDVYPCAEHVRLESSGYFGFHLSEQCAECEYVERGWEFWGENGHLQGHAKTRVELVHWIKRKARDQWKATTDVQYPKGSLIGYRFVIGGVMTYLGQRKGEN